MEEIGTEFELDDLLYLLKRALRNTQLILAMMDRFEALMGIGDEVGLLGKQVFSSVVELLDRLEQEGLFIQSRDLLNSLAQTNILADMNQMVIAYQSTAGQDLKAPSLGPLLWEFNQPETKKGLFCILKVLQALGE